MRGDQRLVNEICPEILIAAHHLMQARGRDALGRALRRSNDLRDIGAVDAAEIWLEIADAIRSIETGKLEE